MKTHVLLAIGLAVSALIIGFTVPGMLWSAPSPAEINNRIGVNPQATPSTRAAPASWKPFTMPSKEELKATLSPLQYQVTQNGGTETPFKNPYWDNYEKGIYIDVVSGEPLFSSKNKYHSGTGWPSFTAPLEPENVVLIEHDRLFVDVTEAVSKHAGSHLGHVFNDGPITLEASGGAKPTGLRYCMNSAALRFIPADELEEKGYGQYAHLFD